MTGASRGKEIKSQGQAGAENSAKKGTVAMTATYATVAKAFELFKLPQRELGGHIREGKQPRLQPRITDEQEDTDDEPGNQSSRQRKTDYVGSSFNEEQRIYVGATIAALNTLAQGRVVTRGNLQIKDLSTRIVEHFRGQQVESSHFSTAVIAATLDLYTDLGHHYPNLIPALDPLLKIAGTEGTAAALRITFPFLKEALVEEYDADTTKLHVKLLSPPERFTKIHPLHVLHENEDPDRYEVWCSGEAFAKTILRQAAHASLILAEDQTVRDNYDSRFDYTYLSIRNAQLMEPIDNHISQIVEAVSGQNTV